MHAGYGPVAARENDEPGTYYILSTVVDVAASGEITVEDAVDSDNKFKAHGGVRCCIYSRRFKRGERVLALYEGTTTFNPAEVVCEVQEKACPKTKGYRVKFDEEEVSRVVLVGHVMSE